MSYPHTKLDDAAQLASYQGWSHDVYEDFFRLQQKRMTESEFREKYHRECAILSMDMTGFTSSAMRRGELHSLLRILDAQTVIIPVLHEFNAQLIRCFADDIVALFPEPNAAVDAAIESHRRIKLFNESSLASDNPTRCCAGIGFGNVFAIGPNLAQGDEMNRASKLGEDIARANETLITENVYTVVKHRDEFRFEPQQHDDQLFPFYRVSLRD